MKAYDVRWFRIEEVSAPVLADSPKEAIRKAKKGEYGSMGIWYGKRQSVISSFRVTGINERATQVNCKEDL